MSHENDDMEVQGRRAVPKAAALRRLSRYAPDPSFEGIKSAR